MIGFIGLGQIGNPIAAHLLDWPGGLIVHDVREEAMAALVARGARRAASPTEVAEAASVISVMVLDDDQVRSVVGELIGGAKRGTIIAIHSTIRAETAEELAATAGEEAGILVVDAPVTGGVEGARQGSLAVMIGGEREAYERCVDPFGLWATLLVHVGPVGAGTRAKLARNLIHYVSYTAAFEAQRLAEAAGIDPRQLARVVRHSDAITGGPGAFMVGDDPAPPAPKLLGEKDLSLALALADRLGVDLPMTTLALDRFAAEIALVERA